MNVEAEMMAVDETPSALAAAHARAGRCCELCGVKNFAIGGRSKSGSFKPLFQVRADPGEARSKIGSLAWCGQDAPEFVARIFRVVCELATIVGQERKTLLLCCRCVEGVREHAPVELVE